jgi:hypothetical protein
MKKIHLPKKIYFLILIVAVAIICVIAKMAYAPSPTSQVPSITEGPVTLRGTVACMPHRETDSSRPQTLECALGLKGEDGNYYFLTGSASTPITKINQSKAITVKGILQKDTDTIYQSRGKVVVDEIIE